MTETPIVKFHAPPAVIEALRIWRPTFGPELPVVVMVCLQRLLSDRRMDRVWAELSRERREKYRSSGKPLHKATLPEAVSSWAALADAELQRAMECRKLGDEVTAAWHELLAQRMKRLPTGDFEDLVPEESQQLGLVLFFFSALAAFVRGDRTVTRKDVERLVQNLRERGNDEVANNFEAMAADPQNARFINERQRSDPRIEAFVEAMSATSHQLYGHSNHSTLATLVNVVFDRKDFKRDRVRVILKRRSKAVSP